MTQQQLGILNALVTFAAENIPGGLSEDERVVARIVGGWAIAGTNATKTHNYKAINTSHHKSLGEAANFWAEHGWRVVGAMTKEGPGYADQLILERPVGVSHPDD
jgi:hypothetical protein